MKHCNKHNTVLTYKAGKENILFCKACEKLLPPKVNKKPWWKFW